MIRPDEREPSPGDLPIREGSAFVFTASLERHHVLADDHLDLLPEQATHFLFTAAAPEFGAAFRNGDVVVTAGGFIEDGAELIVPAALQARGVTAIVARRFGARFLRQALDIGLPPLVVDEAAAVRTGDRLRIDIEQHVIANLSSGDRYVIRNLDDDELRALRTLHAGS